MPQRNSCKANFTVTWRASRDVYAFGGILFETYSERYAPAEQLTGKLQSHAEGFACDVYAFGGILVRSFNGSTRAELQG